MQLSTSVLYVGVSVGRHCEQVNISRDKDEGGFTELSSEQD